MINKEMDFRCQYSLYQDLNFIHVPYCSDGLTQHYTISPWHKPAAFSQTCCPLFTCSLDIDISHPHTFDTISSIRTFTYQNIFEICYKNSFVRPSISGFLTADRMRPLLVSVFIFLVTCEKDIDDNDKKPLDPLRLAATDTEMMWLREDGSYK